MPAGEGDTSTSFAARRLLLNAWILAALLAVAGVGLLVAAVLTTEWRLAVAAVLLGGGAGAQGSIVRRRRKTLGPRDIDEAGYAALVGALTFLGFVGAVVLCMTAA